MSETKRPISQVSTDAGHDDKKQNIAMAGPKPIDTEPKSRRTAQNRAAQRKFRERKKRKMKDLEEKVALLEDEKMKALSEQNILRAQIDLLKRELHCVTGLTTVPVLDSLPQAASVPAPKSTATPFTFSSFIDGTNQWSLNTTSTDFNLPLQSLSSQRLPELVSGLSSSSSPLNNTLNMTPSSTESGGIASVMPSFDNQVNHFCNKLRETCGGSCKPVPKVKRWGNPVPPYEESYADAFYTLHNLDSQFQTLFSPGETLSDPLFAPGNPAANLNLPPNKANAQYDSLAFLSDAGFDVSLAFGNSLDDIVEKGAPAAYDDKLASLVTKKSMFGPLAKPNPDLDFSEYVKHTPSSAKSSRSTSESEGHRTASILSFNKSPTIFEEREDVIPAGKKSMKCPKIWDRITAHPRYTEIDIDGLCSELYTKAKFLEKGVVINVNDVNSLIEQSACRKA